MKMNDRSTDGKIYLGGFEGRDTRTGLSRRRGGRCCGKRVCCFTGTPVNIIGSFMLGRKTRIWTLETCVVLENDRLSGAGFGGSCC